MPHPHLYRYRESWLPRRRQTPTTPDLQVNQRLERLAPYPRTVAQYRSIAGLSGGRSLRRLWAVMMSGEFWIEAEPRLANTVSASSLLAL